MSKIGMLKNLLQTTASSLKGHAKRLFMARTVRDVFDGVAYRAEQELGWNRVTISKGLHELASGIECIDGRRGATGRKPAEAHLPNLLSDIRDLLDSQSHTDARFRTHRLYTRMSVAEVRRQLQAKKGYRDEELPSEETLRCKVNKLDPLVKTPIFKKTFRWCRRGKIGQSSVDRRRSAVNCRFQRCSAPLWDGSRRKDAVSRRSWGLERRRRPQLGPGGPRSA